MMFPNPRRLDLCDIAESDLIIRKQTDDTRLPPPKRALNAKFASHSMKPWKPRKGDKSMARRKRGRSKPRVRSSRVMSKSRRGSRHREDVRLKVTVYRKKSMSTIAYIQSTDILSKAAELLNRSVDNNHPQAVDFWNGVLDRGLGTNRSIGLPIYPRLVLTESKRKRILAK